MDRTNLESMAEQERSMTILDDAELETWTDGDDIVFLVDWEEA